MAVPFSYEQAQNVRNAWTPGGGPNGTLHMVWEWRHPGELTAYADVGYVRSTTSKTAQIVLAGVVGLLAVGLILLAAGLIGRKGSGPESATGPGGKAKAGVG